MASGAQGRGRKLALQAGGSAEPEERRQGVCMCKRAALPVAAWRVLEGPRALLLQALGVAALGCSRILIHVRCLFGKSWMPLSMVGVICRAFSPGCSSWITDLPPWFPPSVALIWCTPLRKQCTHACAECTQQRECLCRDSFCPLCLYARQGISKPMQPQAKPMQPGTCCRPCPTCAK